MDVDSAEQWTVASLRWSLGVPVYALRLSDPTTGRERRYEGWLSSPPAAAELCTLREALAAVSADADAAFGVGAHFFEYEQGGTLRVDGEEAAHFDRFARLEFCRELEALFSAL